MFSVAVNPACHTATPGQSSRALIHELGYQQSLRGIPCMGAVVVSAAGLAARLGRMRTASLRALSWSPDLEFPLLYF